MQKMCSRSSDAARPWQKARALARSLSALSGKGKGILSAATPGAPAAASVVLGAVEFLLNAAGEVSGLLSSVEGLLELVCGFVGRLEGYVQEFRGASGADGEGQAVLGEEMPESLKRAVVNALATTLEVLGECEKLVKDGRRRRLGKALVLGEDEKVKALLVKLERILDGESRAVAVLAYRTGRRVEARVGETRALVEEMVGAMRSKFVLGPLLVLVYRRALAWPLTMGDQLLR